MKYIIDNQSDLDENEALNCLIISTIFKCQVRNGYCRKLSTQSRPANTQKIRSHKSS